MHLGFIMDGNRRWAKTHALATLLGHTKGADVMEDVIDYCLDEEADVASFWALAKKNIEERSDEELAFLYGLLIKRVGGLIPKLFEKNMRLRWIGNREIVRKDVRDILEKTEADTAGHTGMVLVIAIGYGGQDEIVRAVKRAIKEGAVADSLDEKTLLPYLDTGDLPPPDLIVRTGGDVRHSGYFLYQAEYSEYHYSDLLWPDFDHPAFDEAIASLKGAKRNFGK